MEILYLVDCQKDFMDKNGALYVPNAEKIKKRIVDLTKAKKWDTILVSLDTHTEDYKNTEEAKSFPPHCIVGTRGYDLFNELSEALIDVMREENSPITIINKSTYDVWEFFKESESALTMESLVDSIIGDNEDVNIVFAGVATDYCVKAAMEGFAKRYPTFKLTVEEASVAGISKEAFSDLMKNDLLKNVTFALDFNASRTAR